MNHFLRSHSSRPLAFTTRQYLLAAAVVTVVSAAGFGGYMYVRSNSPNQLAIKAQIALTQHDSTRAIAYLQKALDKNPTGDIAVTVRTLMARALIDSGREADARPYLEDAMKIKSDDAEALDLMAETYWRIGFRKMAEAPKPLGEGSVRDILATVDAQLAALEKMPQIPRYQVAQAQLHRLAYMIDYDQLKQANSRLSAAKLAGDNVGIDKATQQIAAVKNPTEHQERALELLHSALKQDPSNVKAAQFVLQYEFQDRHFAQALQFYDKIKAEKLASADLAITAANVMIADTARQPVRKTRFADGQKELEAYLAEHPKDPSLSRVYVAIGQTLLEQDKASEASAMAAKATAASPGDLDAQILLVNAKLREKKTAEALSLATPMASSYPNVPQVWYLLGLTHSESGDLLSAENDFKKALFLNPGYTAARRNLLYNAVRSGHTDSATLLATQLLKEDPYCVQAWEVEIQDFQKRGQADRSKALLLSFAVDPDLPPEVKPELIQLLVKYGAPEAAQSLLATLPPNDEATLRLRSMVAAGAGNLGEARTLMATDIAANPADADLRLRYAELLLKSRLPADARAQLDTVVKSAAQTPLSAGDWLRTARGYLFLRLPEQALAATKQALANQPRSLEAQSLQQEATAMLTGGPASQEAPSVDPGKATIADIIRLASAALVKKDYPGTLSLARAGLARDAGNVPLHHMAARALAGLGQYDNAVKEIVAAAQTQKGSATSFATFVELFPPEEATKGLGFGSTLQAINPALGNWAMGRLAENAGNADMAMTYYKAGLDVTGKTLDPAGAKDVLFRAVLSLDASKKDPATLKKDTDAFARDPAFTIGVRLIAADHLRLLGDISGVAEQLDKITSTLTGTPPPAVVLYVAQGWENINRSDKALAILEKYLPPANSGKPRDPQLLDAYAKILQQQDPARALKIRQEIVAADPSNPQHKIALAQSLGAMGDEAGAFRALDEARSTGETGRTLASAARMRMLITLGLLKEAAGELDSQSSATDFGSMLAIGQSWAQLNKPDDARKILSAIPSYATEYPAAVGTLASLDAAAGNFDAAIAALQPKGAALAPELFQTYLRAGKPDLALQLAKKQQAQYPENTPPWRNWMIYAATAAREARNYDDAIKSLNALEPDARKAAAFDIAMLELLQNKPDQAAQTAAAIDEEAPTYSRSTILLLAKPGSPLPTPLTTLIASGPASTVYAYLAANPTAAQAGALRGLEKNYRILPQDIDVLMKELSADPAKAGPTLRQLAIIQRLIESGWTTTALSLLDDLDKNSPKTTLAMLQRQRALTELNRTREAAAITAQLSEQAKDPKAAIAPSVRILVAAAASQKEDYPAAIAALEPLVPLNRTDILTTLATFYEKVGDLDKAIALHRQVRKLDPDNVLAANNLAYTLSAAHPNDKAALAEAKKAVQFAIDKAPQVAVFQDTLGWIEILSGQPADGVKRLARCLPALRLSPAVHYHLGVGYAKLGQTDLARLHLQNVQNLAQSKTPIPELPLATEALKTLASTQK